ncbi:hypothetical protein Cme02nite_38620 [Catellatospora methionotrophica]|uniref:Uncharacterized protein n=1 Tax=Catellatospora methionotrophica TaxID=121620 RepID=A0A8J3LB64_9ACTN|nr:hypothetical protein [Catellatospora methionotrophica]GIG15530.1 hypothetical protein Cme02nite_38620 [Catellatospora methionotrophica]
MNTLNIDTTAAGRLVVVAEKDPSETRGRLWFIRRWAATGAWNLHVRWRHRAVMAEAALRHVKEELAREQELRREEAKRADAWKREVQGKVNKLLQLSRDLDTARQANTFLENRIERLTAEAITGEPRS